jgi:cell division protein FtsB
MRYRRFKRRRVRRRTPPRYRVRNSKLVPKLLLLIGVVLVIIFFFGDHGIYKLYQKKREKERILQEIDRLREEQQALLSEKDRLENDLEYIEKLARERHRMAKPGEKVFKVVESQKD